MVAVCIYSVLSFFVHAWTCSDCERSTGKEVADTFAVIAERRSLSTEEAKPVVSTFFELATERFEARADSSAADKEEDGTFKHLQVINFAHPTHTLNVGQHLKCV